MSVRCPRARNAAIAAALLVWVAAAQPLRAGSSWEDLQPVPREQIVAAMQLERAQGYALDAISNSVRLQVGVFLKLAADAEARDPARRPLHVDHEDYYFAFLEASGVAAERIPAWVAVPRAFGEDYLIDYRMENVIARVERGTMPQRALNVKAGWPARPGAPDVYTYEDTSTSPTLEATHAQVNAYRILDYGDLIVYDDIRGVTGRATSGVLGAIFVVLGKARAVQTRFAIAPDGLQVSRTQARKLISVTQTVTIYPDGAVLKGLPDGRADLEALERRLSEPLRIEYVPFELSPIPPAPGAG